LMVYYRALNLFRKTIIRFEELTKARLITSSLSMKEVRRFK